MDDRICSVEGCWNWSGSIHPNLEAVTPQVNTLRSSSPSAGNARKTHCVRGHAFAGDNLRFDKNGHRVCVACRRLHSRRVLTQGGEQP